MDKITQDTNTRAETRLCKPSKSKMIAHWNVSVSRYDSGGLVASHARLDSSSGRYVFTRLSNPGLDFEGPHYLAVALVDAAIEVLDDVRAGAVEL